MLSESKYIKFCKDKYATYKFFLKNNIKTPETAILDKDSLKIFMKKYKIQIIKPRYGKQGIGIKIAKNNQEILKDYIIQEPIFCKKNNKYFDIRVFHQKPNYYGAYLRVSDEFKTNLSQKGRAEELSYFGLDKKKIIQETKKIINLLDYDFFEIGVDILSNDNELYFLELNYSCGLSGFIRLGRKKDMDIIYKNRLKYKGKEYVMEKLSNFKNLKEKNRLMRVIKCAE